jgi:hypothetical protein
VAAARYVTELAGSPRGDTSDEFLAEIVDEVFLPLVSPALGFSISTGPGTKYPGRSLA